MADHYGSRTGQSGFYARTAPLMSTIDQILAEFTVPDIRGKLGPSWLPVPPDYYLTEISDRAVMYGPRVMVEMCNVLYTVQDMNDMWPEIRRARLHLQLRQQKQGVEVVHFFKPRW